MSKLTLSLSWPEPVLWPNKKSHWAAKTEFMRAARDEAYTVTKAALEGEPYTWKGGTVWLTVTGHKSAERGQDRDGFSSALKPAYDGIAAALGVNDKYFAHVVGWGEKDPPRGSVTVVVSQ